MEEIDLQNEYLINRLDHIRNNFYYRVLTIDLGLLLHKTFTSFIMSNTSLDTTIKNFFMQNSIWIDRFIIEYLFKFDLTSPKNVAINNCLSYLIYNTDLALVLNRYELHEVVDLESLYHPFNLYYMEWFLPVSEKELFSILPKDKNFLDSEIPMDTYGCWAVDDLKCFLSNFSTRENLLNVRFLQII